MFLKLLFNPSFMFLENGHFPEIEFCARNHHEFIVWNVFPCYYLYVILILRTELLSFLTVPHDVRKDIGIRKLVKLSGLLRP